MVYFMCLNLPFNFTCDDKYSGTPSKGHPSNQDNLNGHTTKYCKATYLREVFIFANSRLLGASRKLNDMKI